MKIAAAVSIGLMSALAYAAGPGSGRAPQAPQLQSAPRMEKMSSLSDRDISRLSPADRAEQCTQQARSQDLQGDDYRLFVIRCMNRR